MSLPFSYVIGLEVHVELGTATKMFCRCANNPFNAEPNTNTCPICLGLPGTLPVPNKEAVRRTIILGKALGSTIPKFCKFDRKHYFYPDNPKGYQISQYDLPLCVGGQVELLTPEGETEKTVHFERVHLEEDAGKLLHGADRGYSQVDLNRAGVPLMEMVSKPDLNSPEEARRFLQELRLLVRTLGISEGDMEKGQMRCDVNVSIKFEHEGEKVWTPITEIKNVNSTRAVERSLVVEAQRLYDEWLANGPIRIRKFKLTAGWDENTNSITINRTKESSADYRYMPEPDIPPLMVYELEDLTPEKVNLPELPNARRRRYLSLGISGADIETLLSNEAMLSRLEEHLERKIISPKVAANWLINVPPAALAPIERVEVLAQLVEAQEASFSAVRQKVEEIFAHSGEVRQVVKGLGLLQAHDAAVVQSTIREVLNENPNVVQQYKDGQTKVLGFIVGQVMKRAQGKAIAAKVQEAVVEALQAS